MTGASQRVKASSALLRYRFDDVAQLREHLHVIDGRGLLFFRDPKAAFASGQPVLLEVMLGGSDQQSILRGQVLGRDEGRAEGLWLEFPDVRLARRAAEGPIASRRQRRLPTDLLIELRSDNGPAQLCRLLDVSVSGARVGGLSMLIDPGSRVEVRLVASDGNGMPSGTCRALALRQTGSEVALRIARDDAATRQLITKLQMAVQAQWQAAREITHPAICCKGGSVLEPPLPHLSGRMKS